MDHVMRRAAGIYPGFRDAADAVERRSQAEPLPGVLPRGADAGQVRGRAAGREAAGEVPGKPSSSTSQRAATVSTRLPAWAHQRWGSRDRRGQVGGGGDRRGHGRHPARESGMADAQAVRDDRVGESCEDLVPTAGPRPAAARPGGAPRSSGAPPGRSPRTAGSPPAPAARLRWRHLGRGPSWTQRRHVRSIHADRIVAPVLPGPRSGYAALSDRPMRGNVVGNGIEVIGSVSADDAHVLSADALAFVAELQGAFGSSTRGAAGASPGASRRARGGWRRSTSSVLPRPPRCAWRVADAARRPARPTRGDHRASRAQDAHQRAEQRRPGLHGRPGGCPLADLVERRRWPGGPAACGPPRARLHQPGGQALRAERGDRHARRPATRLAPDRATRRSSTASRCRPACSTSGCTCSMPGGPRWSGGAVRRSAPTTTCPSSRATWRRGSGTTSSGSARSAWASRRGRSGRRCSSRPSGVRSRWTPSSTSCGSTPRDSTRVAGTTSSASSRRSASDPTWSCRTAPR